MRARVAAASFAVRHSLSVDRLERVSDDLWLVQMGEACVVIDVDRANFTHGSDSYPGVFYVSCEFGSDLLAG